VKSVSNNLFIRLFPFRYPSRFELLNFWTIYRYFLCADGLRSQLSVILGGIDLAQAFKEPYPTIYIIFLYLPEMLKIELIPILLIDMPEQVWM